MNLNLPIVNDNDKISLPLVLTVVLRYWGEDDTKLKLDISRTAIPTIIDGLQIAEKNNFSSFIYKGSISDLKKRLDQGIPPIVIFPGIYNLTQHAIIVSGYNTNDKRIVTYVPQPNTEGSIPEPKFESQWEQDNYITILLIPSDMKNIILKDQLKHLDSNRICFEVENDFIEGRLNDAVRKLTDAINIDNDNSYAWSLLGSCYNQMNSKQSVKCFNRAITFNPNYFLAFRGLGNFYLKNKDYKNAEKYYSAAIDVNPTRYGPIYKNRALCRLQLNKNPEAKQDLLAYLEKTPDTGDEEQILETIRSLSSN